MITPMVVGVFFLFQVDGTLGNVMGFNVQFQESEISPGLSQDFVDGYIKFFKSPPIINWTVGSQSGVLSIKGFPISGYNCGFPIRGPQLESYG